MLLILHRIHHESWLIMIYPSSSMLCNQHSWNSVQQHAYICDIVLFILCTPANRRKTSSLLSTKSRWINISGCTPAECGNFSDVCVMRRACFQRFAHIILNNVFYAVIPSIVVQLFKNFWRTPSETLVNFYQTALRHNKEQNCHRHVNLRSCTVQIDYTYR